MTTQKKNFTFEHRGKTLEFEKSLDRVQSPGWLRANRRRDEMDLAFTILEDVAGDEVLEAVDEMTPDEFSEFLKALKKEMTASLGE